MTELFYCPECAKEYKTEQGLWKHLIAKHGWTKESYTQWVLNTIELEPGPEVVTATGQNFETITVSVDPEPDEGLTPRGQTAALPPDGQLTAPAQPTDDELIAIIMADPLLGPVFKTIMEVNADLQQFKADTVAVLKDINNSIEYLRAVPSTEPDLMAGFDRIVERLKLEEPIQDLVKKLPTILDRVTGGDPVTEGLGPEFMNRMKQAYLEEQDRRNVALKQLERALSRGEEVFLMSPEEAERARKQGFIKEEPDAG